MLLSLTWVILWNSKRCLQDMRFPYSFQQVTRQTFKVFPDISSEWKIVCVHREGKALSSCCITWGQSSFEYNVIFEANRAFHSLGCDKRKSRNYQTTDNGLFFL